MRRDPSYYTDVFDFFFNPNGLAITFGLTSPRQTSGKPAPSTDQVVIRMSLEQAKILSMLLRKTLSNYERENRIAYAKNPLKIVTSYYP